ncbi:MAG: MlaD family protein [Gemmatimonadota bacterium]|nr:MlaD family protein [Gemmatimonadota bacterium]
MKRATFITWDQLKVGGLIVIALGVMTVAIVQLGAAANLFERRYEIVTFLPNANGLREGGSVTVAGQLAGIIKAIDFLPVDADTSRNLRVIIEINQSLQPQVREDSRARVRTLGLLGDKVLDISVGTPQFAALPPGDTILTSESLDYEQVMTQAAGAVDDMVQLTADMRTITGGIVRGEGTMGQLLMNPTLYEELGGAMTELNRLLDRLQQPGGTFGRLIDDPTLYNRMVSMTSSLDTLLAALNSREGTLGKLLTDDTLYTRLVGITSGADSLLTQLRSGSGFAARMLNDQDLYDKLNKAITDLNAILEDVRRDPRKYTRGMIKVF